MHTETVTYYEKNTELKGYIAYNKEVQTPRPAVIVAHTSKGQNEFARNKAKALADLGYVGFAADLYGEGKEVQGKEEAQALMNPLFQDRYLFQDRIKAAYEAIRKHPMVDSNRIGGIGFCFGGLAIIELFRSGVNVRGVVSFHAVLGNEQEGHRVKTVPIAKGIQGSILILHGYDDPLVTAQDIQETQKELTDAQVDWQMHIYGNTSHAFTVPDANDKKLGLIFNKKASERSWKSMTNFFEEIFS